MARLFKFVAQGNNMNFGSMAHYIAKNCISFPLNTDISAFQDFFCI